MNVGGVSFGLSLCEPPLSPCSPQAFQAVSTTQILIPGFWMAAYARAARSRPRHAEQKGLETLPYTAPRVPSPTDCRHLHLTTALLPYLPPHHPFPSHHPFFLILSLPFSGLRVPGLLHLRPVPRNPARRLTRRLQAAACGEHTGTTSAPQLRDWGPCHRLGTNGAQRTPRGPQHGDSRLGGGPRRHCPLRGGSRLHGRSHDGSGSTNRGESATRAAEG